MDDSKHIYGNDDADCWCLGFRVLLEEECCGDADDTADSRQEKCRTERSFCDADVAADRRSAEQDAASVMLMLQQTGEMQNRTQLL